MSLTTMTTPEALALLEGRLCRQGMILINLEIARCAAREWLRLHRNQVADYRVANVTTRGPAVRITGGLTVYLAARLGPKKPTHCVTSAVFEWYDLFLHPPELESLVYRRLDNALAASVAGH